MFIRRILAVAVVLQPMAASADGASIVPIKEMPDLFVNSPDDSNPLTGGGPEVWDVVYPFNNLEYSIPEGGGGVEFALPNFTNVKCSSAAGAAGTTNVACRFDWVEQDIFQLTNTGSIDSIRFTVPEPSTWAIMLVGFAGLGLAALRNSRKLDSRGRVA
jgi:PEP-CTERM motif